MTCLGNIIWIIFGGLWSFISWSFVGILWCITIIGIPVGKQCFKLARLGFAPFGKKVIEGENPRLFANLLWLLFGGFFLAISHLLSALVLAITIIGIPFALQQLKMARLSLFPFGAEIVNIN